MQQHTACFACLAFIVASILACNAHAHAHAHTQLPRILSKHTRTHARTHARTHTHTHTHTQIRGLRGAAAAWKQAIGPAGAALLTVLDLGWGMTGPWLVDAGGEGQLDLRETGPVEIFESASRRWQDLELQRWAGASAERAGLCPRPWLLGPQQLLGRRRTAHWSRHHASVVRVAVMDGFPEQDRLYASGAVASELCPMCGVEAGNS